FLLARGNHDLGAVLGHAFGNRAPDPARGAGDDGHFSGHVEQSHMILPSSFKSSADRPPCLHITPRRCGKTVVEREPLAQPSLVGLARSGPAGWCIALCEASAIHGCWFTIGSRQPL